MRGEDLDRVLQLERRCFGDPWSRASFESEVADHDGLHWAQVALRGSRLAGYVVAWFVLDEAHVANLAVAPMYRFHGLGRRLVRLALSEARRRGARWVGLEVRMSNAAARALYGSFGFKPTGRRRGYYRNGEAREDALVMTLDLSAPAPSGARQAGGETGRDRARRRPGEDVSDRGEDRAGREGA
jgi:ribosomal-protein-alanine N-acetyltransferase